MTRCAISCGMPIEYLSSFTDGNIEVPVSIIRAMNDVERIAQIEESALPPEKQDVHPLLSPADGPPGRGEWITPPSIQNKKIIRIKSIILKPLGYFSA